MRRSPCRSVRVAEPLDLAQLARIAYVSPWHFHRVFQALTGEPNFTVDPKTGAFSCVLAVPVRAG